MRELKEETGYIGKKVVETGLCPSVFADPWKSNESSKLCIVEIDGMYKLLIK